MRSGLLAALLLLTACRQEERVPVPSAQLNEAAAMLDSLNEEEPAPEGAGSSDLND